jgi:hypothetical protein
VRTRSSALFQRGIENQGSSAFYLSTGMQRSDLMLLPQLEEFGEDVVVEEVHQRALSSGRSGNNDGDQADKEEGGQRSQPERGAAEQVSSTHAGQHGASSRQ